MAVAPTLLANAARHMHFKHKHQEDLEKGDKDVSASQSPSGSPSPTRSSGRSCPVSHQTDGSGTCPFAALASAMGPPGGEAHGQSRGPTAGFVGHGGIQLRDDAAVEDDEHVAATGSQPPPSEPWTAVEEGERQEHLENLKSSVELVRSKPANFGRFFMEAISGSSCQQLREPWSKLSQESAGMHLGDLALEIVRLAHIPSRGELRAAVASLALRHIDYGAKQEHSEAFCSCLLHAVQRHVTCESGTWNSDVEEAWRWTYVAVSEVFFHEMEAVRPKIDTVRLSWRRLLTGQSFARFGSSRGNTLSKASTTASSSGNGSGSGDALNYKAALRSRLSKSKTTNSRSGALNLGVDTNDTKDARSTLVAKVGDAFLADFQESLELAGHHFEFGDQHGEKLGKALEMIVQTATKQQELETLLWRLAKLHVGYGVNAELLQYFEVALFSYLEKSLPARVWEDAEEGWHWLWDRVQASFMNVLTRWQHMQDLVETSWDKVVGLVGSREAVARAFYQKLFEVHPSLQDLFQRPLDAQSKMFSETLQIVVSSVRHSAELDSEVEQLALRHHRYNLKAWHFECVGGVLLSLLGEVAGELFTDEIKDAWSELYRGISNTFLDILEGQNRNLMAQALMRGSLEGVNSALAATPRGERALCALAVPAGSSTLSPLLWAIRDGFRDIAQLLLADLVAIRADRTGYYHGVSELWIRCPGVLPAILEFAPQLLELLLDGHMLVDKEAMEGMRRVNLWVSHIYGDPEIVEDVYCSPLGLLVDQLPEAFLPVFSHPVIATTVDLKWQHFGRSRILMLIAKQMGCLICLVVYQAVHPSSLPWLNWTVLITWLVLCCSLLIRTIYYIGYQVVHQRLQSMVLPGNRFIVSLPRCLLEAFVWLRIICCTLSVWLISKRIGACRSGFQQQSCEVFAPSERYLMAVISAMQWIQVMESFKLSNKLSAVLYIGVAMIRDALCFMAVVLVWLVALGTAIHHLVALDCEGQTCEGESRGFAAGIGSSAVFMLLQVTLGIAGEETALYEGNNQVVVKVLFTVALWMALIPLLNLVISAMVSTYTRVEEFTKDLAVRARADLLLQVEDIMGQSARRRHWEALHFEEPLELARLEHGLPGGISFLYSTKELETHKGFERRTDSILRFSGPAAPEQPWPAHDVPGAPHALSRKHHQHGGHQAGEQMLERLVAGMAELRLMIRQQQQQQQQQQPSVATSAALVEKPAAAAQLQPQRPQSEIPETFMKTLQAGLGKDAIVLAVDGQVYNAGSFADAHPGGAEALRKYGGLDATDRFSQHSNVARAREALAQLPCLGTLAKSSSSV